MLDYQTRIIEIHKSLEIPENYERDYGLPMIHEGKNLVSMGSDVFDREQFIAQSILENWQAMLNDAHRDGIVLQVVSAYRSVEYQADLIRAKLNKGVSIGEILKVNAAPGFSEHHSGCALDLTTAGFDAVSEAFEESEAFNWLMNNADRYEFSLSYPKEAKNKIIYEPWHWAVQKAL